MEHFFPNIVKKCSNFTFCLKSPQVITFQLATTLCIEKFYIVETRFFFFGLLMDARVYLFLNENFYCANFTITETHTHPPFGWRLFKSLLPKTLLTHLRKFMEFFNTDSLCLRCNWFDFFPISKHIPHTLLISIYFTSLLFIMASMQMQQSFIYVLKFMYTYYIYHIRVLRLLCWTNQRITEQISSHIIGIPFALCIFEEIYWLQYCAIIDIYLRSISYYSVLALFSRFHTLSIF